jgi:hypothetical protein
MAVTGKALLTKAGSFLVLEWIIILCQRSELIPQKTINLIS